MKPSILLLLGCVCTFASIAQTKTSSEKKKVFLLAVFHFVSNNDGIKFTRESMLSEKRQKEIEELNNLLAGFKPDKIFIEWGPARQVYVDSSFAEYKRDRFALTGNEVYQIGYKLARKLNHSTVYCMDAPGEYLFDTLIATGKKYGQYEHTEKYYNEMKTKFLLEDSLQKLLTIKERLRQLNKKENIMLSHFVNASVEIAPYLGKPGEYGGAEFMGEWYKRNIRMYSNIIRQVEESDKNILIIVGSGHARIIQHFFEDNPNFELVDVTKYLNSFKTL